QQEVLDGALRRERIVLRVGGQQVARQHHQLEGQEQHEQVGRGRDEHRSGEGEDQDRGELGDRQVARLQVVRGERDRERDDRDEQKIQKGREGVDRGRAAERLTGGPPGDGGQDRDDAECKQGRRERRLPAARRAQV